MGLSIASPIHRSNNNKNNNIRKKKKKPVKPLLQPIPVKEIIKHWEQFREYSKKASSLYAFTYLTGARISEINQVRRRDIQFINKDGNKLMVVNMFTLKNRRHKFRKLPIFIKEPYTEMAEELATWVNYYNSFEKLFPYTRQHLFSLLRGEAMKRLKQHRKISEVPQIHTKAYYYDSKKQEDITRPYYPHFLRHCRLSHLAEHHHFDAIKLMYWAGWTDPKLANIYVRMDWRALAEAIQNYSDW